VKSKSHSHYYLVSSVNIDLPSLPRCPVTETLYDDPMQIGGAGLEDCVADGDGGDGLEHVGSDASVEAQVAVPGDDLSEAVLDSCGGHEEEEGRRVLPVYLGCPSVSLSA
jgi:hypothetical protein